MTIQMKAIEQYFHVSVIFVCLFVFVVVVVVFIILSFAFLITKGFE